MYKELVDKKAKLAVIGLGYVGLPIALEFAKKISVIGFDINEDRVELMKKGIDPSNELLKMDFEGCDIRFTSEIEELKEARFFIVAVPTPVDQHNVPDLNPVKKASETIGKVLKKGIMWCTNPPYIPVVPKKIACPLLKNIRD
jgi:UDP-N-acetyl-D-galactosamine dehydrogenase